MAVKQELVYDVHEPDFEERVIRASSERPVVVDFWAPWCAPCRMLSPILEKAVASLDGAVDLAKVNVDQAQGLAARHGVSGIPAVKVFRNGRVAAEFVGLRSAADVREILSRVVPSEADEMVASGHRLVEAGRPEDAEPLYREALAKRPDHAGALLGLAAAAMGRGDHEAARDAASRVDPGTPEHEEAAALIARIALAKECAGLGGKERAERLLSGDPGDLDAAYALASCLAAEEDYRGALEQLVRIVERDRGYREGAAKDAMLRIFTIVGKRSELADEYRSRLARALY